MFHEVSNMVLDINILQGIVIKLNIPIYNNKDILPGPSEYTYWIQMKQSGLWKCIFCKQFCDIFSTKHLLFKAAVQVIDWLIILQ